MVQKKKKTKIKHKKIEQKEGLQEPQKITADESQVYGQESEENIVEEPNIEEGMIYCKSCKKEIEPYPVEHNKWRCPDCNKYTSSPVMDNSNIENLKEVKQSKDRPYEIHSSRNIKFSGNELAQAEMLIQCGVASNFNDLAKKAFNILFLKEKVNKAFSGDTNKMENNEADPKKTMKEIQEQKLMEAYINSMDSGNKSDPMATMMMMKMLENQGKGKDSGSNGFMDKILEMQMMKTMMGGQDSGTLGLKQELAELKHQMQMQQLMNQQQQQQQGNQSSQEYLQRMEAIKAERDMSIKQAEIAAQKERDKNIQLAFDNRRIELENRLKTLEKEKTENTGGQLSTQRINQMKDEIKAVKEMSTILGDKEKGTGEVLMEGLGNVAEKAMPAFQALMEQRKQQQPMQMPMIPQEFPQQLPPGMALAEPSPQPEPQYPTSDMSETEQEMSNQMSDMYLNPRNRKTLE